MRIRVPLLPGETVLLKRGANSVIERADFGLGAMPFDLTAATRLTGSSRGTEAVGGHLYVTGMRLVFRSHPINRVRGRYSILLPEIDSIGDASSGPVRRVLVTTEGFRHYFVVWGIPGLIRMVGLAQQALGPEERTALAELVRRHPDVVADTRR